VARRAGVTPAAPYRHFKDKTALLAAVAEEGFLALCGRLEAALAPVPPADLRGRFGALARAYLTFARAHPAHYRVMFLPEIKSHREHASFHARQTARWRSWRSRSERRRRRPLPGR
jgi:AcrR family transcriptional regulator